MSRSSLLRCAFLALSMISLFFLAGSVHAFWPSEHNEMIRDLRNSGLYSDDAIEMIVCGSVETDLAAFPLYVNRYRYPKAFKYRNEVLEIAATATKFNPTPPPNAAGFHFDNLMDFDAVSQRWSDMRAWVIDQLPRTVDSAAVRRWELLTGMVFHAVQDFYCHSNWVLLVGYYGTGSLEDPTSLPTCDELLGLQAESWKTDHPRFNSSEIVLHLTAGPTEGKEEFGWNGQISWGLETGEWRSDLPGPGFRHRHPGERGMEGREGVWRAFPRDTDPFENEKTAALVLAARATLQWAQLLDSLLSTYPVGDIVRISEGGRPRSVSSPSVPVKW